MSPPADLTRYEVVKMSDRIIPKRELTDVDIASLLRAASAPPNTTDDLETVGASPDQELWDHIKEQWTDLGLAWSDAVAARLFDVVELTLKGWRMQEKLSPTVRRRLEAFCVLVTLIAGGKLYAVSDQDLQSLVTRMRGLTEAANSSTVEEVLSVLRSQLEELGKTGG